MSTAPKDQTRSTLDPAAVTGGPRASVTGGARMALTACVLGMFVITLDAVVVNVALPSISRDLGGGITGLQ